MAVFGIYLLPNDNMTNKSTHFRYSLDEFLYPTIHLDHLHQYQQVNFLWFNNFALSNEIQLPERSVTSISPLGNQAIPHGHQSHQHKVLFCSLVLEVRIEASKQIMVIE